eukprot:s2776_g1.t1
MVDAAHLPTLKRFHHKFQKLALAMPRDPAFRSPTIQEVLDADRSIWISIFAVQSENKWKLDDSINEVLFCRQELQGLLQPRLRAALGPKQQNSKRSDPVAHHNGNKSQKSKKAKLPDKPPGTSKTADQYPSHWFRKYNGTGICVRFNLGLCKAAANCRYLHICPIPDQASGFLLPTAFFFDIFAGARAPVCSFLHAQGFDCLEPLDKINGPSHDILDDAVYEGVLRLAASNIVKLSLAAPYCSKHSRATLFPGGPQSTQRVVMGIQFCKICRFRNQPLFMTGPEQFLIWLTAEYPPQLVEALATCFAPRLSRSGRTIKLDEWIQGLPRNPTWSFASQFQRIEDGGSLVSTARWHSPPSRDYMCGLRSSWSQRLFDSGLHLKIASSLQSGSDSPPISETELAPFFDDLRNCFGIDAADWQRMLTVTPGQPFRLHLWQYILQLWQDPDAKFCDELASGVRLGVGTTLEPSPIWPLHDGEHFVPDQPLSIHHGQWAGADAHPDIVSDLLQQELDAGWIVDVPGGLTALQQQHSQVAVGKLNAVLASGRSARLVVDSSVSGVTSNTFIPNRMTLPRITDVIAASPDKPSQLSTIGLTLDIAKAHRRIMIHPEDQGLLCFHFGGRLFKCVTLNFGARASGYYWGRGRCLKVMYLFAGARRQSDVGSFLTQMASDLSFEFDLQEIDIGRSSDHDLTEQSLWDDIHRLLRDGDWVLFVSPPCNTFSRARYQYAKHPGPHPLRSCEYPKGFPWLSDKNAAVVNEANQFIYNCIEAIQVCQSHGGHYLLEHPEDLGQIDGQLPGSIWHWNEVHELVIKSAGKTFAIQQCQFGALTLDS